jgi:hypothetical protein
MHRRTEEATRGNVSVKLDVALLPRKDCKIAFRFLRHLDQSGMVINATRWTPEHVPWTPTRLNWTFGAQANISFTLVEPFLDVRPDRRLVAAAGQDGLASLTRRTSRKAEP